MAKNHSVSLRELEQFRDKRLISLQDKEATLASIAEQLKQLTPDQMLEQQTLLSTFMDEFSTARMIVANAKPTVARFCRYLDNNPRSDHWQVLLSYLVSAEQLLKCAQDILANQPLLQDLTRVEFVRQISSFEQVFSEIRSQVAVNHNLKGNLQFAKTSAVFLSQHQQAKQRRQRPFANPLYAAVAKICIREINKVGVAADDIKRQLVNTLLQAPGRTRLINLAKGKNTIPAVICQREPNSDRWLLPVSGAGGHPFALLDTINQVASKVSANYAAVDHVVEGATDFTQARVRLLTLVEYLQKVKGVSLANIVLVGHSNGGRLAMEAAAIVNSQARYPGQGCKVVLHNSYTSLEEAVANLAKNAVAKPNHQPVPSVNEQSGHGLVTKLVGKALNQEGIGYHVRDLEQVVKPWNIASIYTGVKTQHNERGQKLRKPRDLVLGKKSQEGPQHNKFMKAHHPEHYQAVRQANLEREQLQFSYCNKDIYRSDYPDSHLTYKRYVSPEMSDMHNFIDPAMIALAVTGLFQQQAELEREWAEDTLKQRFAALLSRKSLDSVLKYELLFCSGLRLEPQELTLIKTIFTRLAEQPQWRWPTQQQLLELFQADGQIAELICGQPVVLERMLNGTGKISEIKRGRKFYQQKLSVENLAEREANPDGRIEGTGSLLKPEQLQYIQQQLQAYQQAHGQVATHLAEDVTAYKLLQKTSMFAKNSLHHRKDAITDAEAGSQFHKRMQSAAAA